MISIYFSFHSIWHLICQFNQILSELVWAMHSLGCCQQLMPWVDFDMNLIACWTGYVCALCYFIHINRDLYCCFDRLDMQMIPKRAASFKRLKFHPCPWKKIRIFLIFCKPRWVNFIVLSHNQYSALISAITPTIQNRDLIFPILTNWRSI